MAAAAEAAPANSVKNLVKEGEKLVADTGCLACHAIDESRKIGLGWGNLYGHDVKLADGTVVKADANYLANSIVNPNAQIVEGYPAGVIPPYDSLLEQQQVDAMVAYIKSLSKVEE